MGWDGAGGYSRQHNFSADASAGIKILALRMDQEMDDIASAIPIAVARNGQNAPTANLPMGGFRHVNVGAPVSVNNYMRSREFIENVPIFMQDVESSADRISVSAQYFTSVSANQAPGDGTRILVRAKSNKSSAVLYLNGHSANVEYQNGDRIASAIVSGGIYDFIYSSVDTAWKLKNPRTDTNEENVVYDHGADPTGASDSTAAIQAAINTGKTVVFPSGTYLANNLTQTSNFQKLRGDGWVTIKKNANGDHFTSSGDDVELNGIGFRGDASSPTYTGDGIVMSGANARLINCGSRWCPGLPVKITGGHAQIIGTCDLYQTTDATSTGYDIQIGASGTATLYHAITNIYTSQSTGGIRFIDCGGQTVVGSQFGKLFVDAGTSPVGVNGGMYTANRILGDVTVEISNSVFVSNQMGAIDIIFGAGTSEHIYADNVEGNGHTITNNGNANSLILRRTSTGSGTITVLYGDDSSLATLEISPSTGTVEFPRNIIIKNTRGITLEGTSGTDALLDMSGANNVGLRNSVSAAGIILTQDGAGTINMDVNGARSAQFDANTTAGNTRFLIYDVDNATLERVTVGSADTGGTGYKVLRIPN
jgi:hypothetical protein